MGKVELEIKDDKIFYSVRVGDEHYEGSTKLTIDNFNLLSTVMSTIANAIHGQTRDLLHKTVRDHLKK